MNRLTLAALAGLALATYALPAGAGWLWYQDDPRIWKAVHALPGEDAWSACRRHFRYDTTRTAHGPGNIIYCYVPYHYIYGPGESRQNFNR